MTIGGLAGSPQHAYIGSRYDTDSLIVQGTIDANVLGQTLRLQGQTITNTGTLRASNGGTLDVRGIAGNAGTLEVTGTGSVLLLDGTDWVNNQSLTIPTGAAVTFSGGWSNTGGVHVTGGAAFAGRPHRMLAAAIWPGRPRCFMPPAARATTRPGVGFVLFLWHSVEPVLYFLLIPR